MRPHLDMRHLQMLVAIAQTGNVTRAAGAIGLTQSALTHRIREAERRLEVVLFTRVGKQLRMTPAAELMTTVAARVLEEVERAEREATEMSEGVEHVVRLGIGSYTRYHWLPAFIKVLFRELPEIQIEVVAGAIRRPIDMLLDGAIDVAIVPGRHSRSELRWIPLFQDELVAISHPRHRFARCSHIEAEAFEGEVYITYSLTQEPGFEGERFMAPASVYPRRFVRVELPEAIVELVRAGLGVSVLSRWAVEPYLQAGSLVATQLTEKGLTLDWFAAVRKSDGVGSPALRLASALAKWCATPKGGFRSVTRPA